MGTYTGSIEDTRYNKTKYFFENAIILRNDKKYESYNTIGLNSTTNLDFKMKHKEPGEKIKILHDKDQPTDKGNPLQIYRVFHMKNNGGEK